MEILPAIRKENLLEKIKNAIKKLFSKNKELPEAVAIQETKQEYSKNKFKEEIKFEEDLEKKKLLEIQKKLEEGEMTIELATKLTKDLTDEEKSNLLELYKTQIEELEKSLENYKRKILAIRKKV